MVVVMTELEEAKDYAREMGRLFAREVADRVIDEIRGLADWYRIDDDDFIYDLFDEWVQAFYDKLCNIAYNVLIH